VPPVERGCAGRRHMAAEGCRDCLCHRKSLNPCAQYTGLLQSKSLLFAPDDLPHPLVDATALKVSLSLCFMIILPRAPGACVTIFVQCVPSVRLLRQLVQSRINKVIYRIDRSERPRDQQIKTNHANLRIAYSCLLNFLPRSPWRPPPPQLECGMQLKRAR
jgi:hypothetical protein